ncbi:hypothetical protein [Chitinimonas taiwanensis]|uniref:Uncharacterized protein n=1 Tax=Chitinimonas taiwanensis DSM 18899 TaxID=1121279 RepID=A0A1K2HJT8_9NEIS|nr:hypothetical protein [Chitinimonas taiwanensis]SFZ77014.1 hypothetical protein SAMN02745887_02194 [Chitinimonas taiwanensis DSM 18899]
MNRDIFRSTQSACLVESDLPLLVEVLDAFEDNGVISTYAPRLRPGRPWRSQMVEGWYLVSAYFWAQSELRCILGREGQVNIYGPGGKPDHIYQIPEAGVFGDAAIGLGYVNRIRAVGDQLYVCGQSRQVYRFEWDGKDLATGRWVDMAGSMRQPPMPAPPEGDNEDAFDAWLDDNNAIDLVDIKGPDINDLYAVGDETWHWNGETWRQLSLPTDEPFAAIKVLNADEIVLVGYNGSVLWGNARDGFRDLSGIEDNQNYTAVEWFDGRLFLASNVGFFTYDLTTRRIAPYRTSLSPDLVDTHHLEAKDGILWSFGFKDLAYFDGTIWTRVDHPDNPPIR